MEEVRRLGSPGTRRREEELGNLTERKTDARTKPIKNMWEPAMVWNCGGILADRARIASPIAPGKGLFRCALLCTLRVFRTGRGRFSPFLA